PVSFSLSHQTVTSAIYTLSLHDALPIFVHFREIAEAPEARARALHAAHAVPEAVPRSVRLVAPLLDDRGRDLVPAHLHLLLRRRSEEHTSELQSQSNLVCRLLLEKKNIF